MFAISSITLINKFTAGRGVEFAEKFVTVGQDEVPSPTPVVTSITQALTCLHFCCALHARQGLALLKGALRSDTVLTDVFLAKKK